MRFSKLQDWLSWQEQLHPKNIDMGLDRIRPVSDALLKKKLAKKVVTVAGTNGKGSIVSTLESLYVSAGYNVGTYTSPHLLNYNERIRINGIPLSNEAIAHAFHHVDKARSETSLTYFEFGTLAAFYIFQHNEIDIVILEVGLGGRLDATNLIDPDVAVVSNIQMDHMDWLGETREEIACEKLGIARVGKPLIIADDDLPSNVLPFIEKNNFSAYILGRDFGFVRQNGSWNWWMDVKLRTDQNVINVERLQKHSLPEPSLRGTHQFKNAAAALCVVSLLNEEFPLSMNHIRVGLNNIALPGRFQVERVEDKTVILDVAHNPHGVGAFIDSLNQMPRIGEHHIVFAMLQDKSLKEVTELLKPVVDYWYLAKISSDRAIPVDAVKSQLLACNNVTDENNIMTFEDVSSACELAVSKMQPNDKLLVLGSFYTVTDAMMYISENG